VATTQPRKMMKNIWMLSREYGDIAGAGGVKDVVCQLAEALATWNGRAVQVVLPRYGFIDCTDWGFIALADPACAGRNLRLQIDMHQPDKPIREEISFFHRRINRVDIYLVEAERFRQKSDVYTYSEVDERRVWWQHRSMGHHDYFAMNLLLQKAAMELIIALAQSPDIIHCHDGHTAVLAAMIRENSGYRTYFRRSACLVTIHNAGHGYHQEIADIPYAKAITELPSQVVDNNRLDHKFDPLLVAGQYALLSTVSENYARELQETDNDRLTGWLGHELLRRGVVLEGVTNGIDPRLFSPASDEESLLLRFDPGSQADALTGKRYRQQALVEQLSTGQEPVDGVERFGQFSGMTKGPLFTFIGRLSEQKGVDILMEAMALVLREFAEARLLVLGSGSGVLESRLIHLSEDQPFAGRICFLRGFHSELAGKIFAAGDFFVIPSRYEPCGLTDFIAQLYGTIPVVRHVGGLVKVIDGTTGIAYSGDSAADLHVALVRAMALYGNKPEVRRIQRQAVKEIFSKYTWNKVMQRYLDLYRRAWHAQVCAAE
jgi:starch synthase